MYQAPDRRHTADQLTAANRAARRMPSLRDKTFANPVPRADLPAPVEKPAGLKDAERAAVARARGNMTAPLSGPHLKSETVLPRKIIRISL